MTKENSYRQTKSGWTGCLACKRYLHKMNVRPSPKYQPTAKELEILKRVVGV